MKDSHTILEDYLNIKGIVSSKSSNTRLLAVSKFHDIDSINPVLRAGHRLFGESRVEEAIDKWADIRDNYEDLELHFIGGLQSRKLRKIVSFFDVIQSVDKISLVDKINLIASDLDKKQRIFIQVNIGNEPQKSGVSIGDFKTLNMHTKSLNNIKIEGIMCIPPNIDDVSVYFNKMNKLAYEYNINELSYGMSNDYELAINCGSTMVRIGSAIFGERHAN